MKKISTELTDRVLRFDGVSVVSPELVARCLLLGVDPTQLRVTDTCWEIEQFNANVPDEELLRLDGPEQVNLKFDWRLPEEYRLLDLWGHVMDTFADRVTKLDYSVIMEDQALHRLEDELMEISRRGMLEFMRIIVYVLDIFRKNDVIWGVGRGSSCASYVLFILGLHVVDCVRLSVPYSEFFHD